MAEVVINPPASAFGRVNAILNGRGTRHYESRFAGPLSAKAVIRGRATWETDEGRYELGPGAALLLNDGEEYTITVDALQPVETFCFFFERGFVEDAYRATVNGSARLLDGQAGVPVLHFSERLHFDVEEVLRAYRDREALGASFYSLALRLVRTHANAAARISHLPSLRSSTREELARRLGVATSYLHANSARGVSIAEAARAACLSPFHFHRLFTRFHGITPHRYLTRLRLERARALLRAFDCSVLDVAIACGFESLGSFSALYKRTFGVTPNSQDSRNARGTTGAILAS
ncbi:MAG TPA: AraC family transcriptional regulator [Thermoanaerobaculia bacterium]|nr:AraC family transcriptional regulator [Thermoanaerobaculia bacterium]